MKSLSNVFDSLVLAFLNHKPEVSIRPIHRRWPDGSVHVASWSPTFDPQIKVVNYVSFIDN